MIRNTLTSPRFGPPVAAILILIAGFIGSARATDWELLPARHHDVDLTAEDKVLNIRTTGTDPYLIGRWTGGRDANDQVLEFEYFCDSGVDSFSAYHGPPFNESNRLDLPALPVAQGWQTYSVDLRSSLGKPLPESSHLMRLDLGTTANVRLRIRQVRLRPPTEDEKKEFANRKQRTERKRNHADRIATYLQTAYPVNMTVRAEEKWVLLSIDLQGLAEEFHPEQLLSGIKPFHVIEYGPQDSIGESGATRAEDGNIAIDGEQKRLLVRLPRRVGGQDRLHSGWRIDLTETPEIDSARHYPTVITPALPDHAKTRPHPKSQKGLSGFSRRGPRKDLVDLGIHGVTINLVLNRFVSLTAGPGKQRIDVPGMPVYFDPSVFAHYDQLIDFARQHEIVVSAIVLIPRARKAPSRSPLVHAEADGGVYAMPDLSNARGVQIYGHVLDAIARRYRNTDAAPGGITNWIAHNEVDYHSVWTNMGQQPRELYTETFYRSMRMIHNAARSHNPHARVFVPLTHHFAVTDDVGWRRLSPREVLETLQRYSALEGDFAWGVAYHPYPQSLWAEVAWNDRGATDSFDTPLITIQNLPVLGRFLEQPQMRDSDGNVRPVILSEQGFHTDSYDDRAQENQAASLLYAMNQVRKLPFIETFHYHRWIDHPDEGGLMLGLRTIPDADHPHGRRKRSWQVYQAIGTDEETAATRDLPRPEVRAR